MNKKNTNKIIEEAEKRLGITFDDKAVLLEAITHKSFVNENNKNQKDNQRLEFLGDSVLSLIITEYIFKTQNLSDEGVMSKIKSTLISKTTLSKLSKKLKLGNIIQIGRGEEASGGRQRDALLEDLFESITGAVYLDKGFDKTKEFVLRAYNDILKSSKNIDELYRDYKTIFQEMVQHKYKTTPLYKTVLKNDDNLKQEKLFISEVFIENKKFAKGVGTNKKQAERNAAQNAIKKL